MATQFGITPTGFVMPQLTDIQQQINQSLYNALGTDINLGAESVFGQISGIMAEQIAEVWQAMQDVYSSQGPDTAFGNSLDNVGALRGIPRLGELPSVAQSVLLFGDMGTLIPVGSQASVINSPSSLFATDNDITLAAGQSCVQKLTFSAVPVTGQWQITLGGGQTGLLNFNSNAAQIQAAVRLLPFSSQCTVTGDYATGFTVNWLGAGTGGFMPQPQMIISSNTLVSADPAPVSVTPSTLTAGVAQGIVNLTAVTPGPTIANAGTLTVIATPITGWTAVLNPTDASVGRLVESDNVYRARMDQELQIAGAGTVEAIRSRLLQVTGVTSVVVFENVTDIDDANGLPPHSFEAFVQGGSVADIGNAIWEVKPAGIKSFGTIPFTITDSQGQVHTVNFSRPQEIDIYMIVTITPDENYPTNGDEIVAQALVDYINALGQGVSIIVIPKLISSLASIPGIEDAQILIGTAPAPTLSNNIPVAINQISKADTSRTQVNS